MSTLEDFETLECSLCSLKYGGMERKILKFWREYAPEKVEQLLAQQILRRTLILTANALFDMQLALEQSEGVHPALSGSEAWRRLMRLEEEMDEADKEADWGPWKEEYWNLLDKLHQSKS